MTGPVMGGSLKGKAALITAAGQGIGRAIAEAFIDHEATVMATDADPRLLNGLACETGSLDVRDREAIENLMRSMPRLDVLVNCAGLVRTGTILETTEQDWSESFEVNARSMFWTMKCAVQSMLSTGGGSIINIASVVSSLKAAPERFVYSASKAAVIAMTKAVAIDFAQSNIRVNAICPGTVDTPSLRERLSADRDPQVARARITARQPIGRLGRPSEVAQLAVYLGSDSGSFATGSAFIVDGGMSL